MHTRLDPRTGQLMRVDPNEVKKPVSFIPELTDAQLARVLVMTQEELIALVNRIAAQWGRIALMTEEETAQAMMDRCAQEALTSADAKAWLPMMREWFDRTKGRPVQQQEVRVTQTPDLDALEAKALAIMNRLHPRVVEHNPNV